MNGEPCPECDHPTTVAVVCDICAYIMDGTVQPGFDPESLIPKRLHAQAERLARAEALLPEVMPTGPHQHVGSCWFCRAKALLNETAPPADDAGKMEGT